MRTILVRRSSPAASSHGRGPASVPGPDGSARSRDMPEYLRCLERAGLRGRSQRLRLAPLQSLQAIASFPTASEREKLITLCLERIGAARIIWRTEAARALYMPIFKGNDAASPTPVSDGTNVYVSFAELGLISYGPDGRERWRAPLGPFNNFYGIGFSPVIAGDTRVMVCDQRTNPFVIAVDVRDGSVRWKIDRSSPVEGYATPIMISPSAGEPQIPVVWIARSPGLCLEDRRASLVGRRNRIRAERRSGARPRTGLRQCTGR